VRLLAEAACEQVIDMLGDIAPPAVADPDERGKLAYLLAWSRVCADERAEQLQGALGLLLAEPADEQLQPLPRCHASSLTANAITCRALQSSGCAGGGGKERRLAAAKRGRARGPAKGSAFGLCEPPPAAFRSHWFLHGRVPAEIPQSGTCKGDGRRPGLAAPGV
jgi:hypothetical protein